MASMLDTAILHTLSPVPPMLTNIVQSFIKTIGLSSMAGQEVYLLPLKDSGAPDVPDDYICLPAPSNPAY